MAVKHPFPGRWGSTQLCIMRRRACQTCFIIIILGVVGCSSSVTVPVTGTVKFASGEPVVGGRILFQPMGELNRPARAVTLSDGSFCLGTFESDDGAVPGVHKVAVLPRVPPEAGDDLKVIKRYLAAIDRRYQNLQRTPLEFTVKDDGSENHFDIVVEPPNSNSADLKRESKRNI